MLRKVGATMRFEYSVRFLYYEVGVSFRQAHAVDYEYMHWLIRAHDAELTADFRSASVRDI